MLTQQETLYKVIEERDKLQVELHEAHAKIDELQQAEELDRFGNGLLFAMAVGGWFWVFVLGFMLWTE